MPKNQIFTNVELASLKASGYNFIECLGYTGNEIETSEEYYRSEMLIKAYKKKPEQSEHYILEIDDEEVDEMAKEDDTVVFYVVKG